MSISATPTPFDEPTRTFEMKGVKVFVGVPVNRDFPAETTRSIAETASLLTAKGIPYELNFIVGGSIVEVARSGVANKFLKSDCTHLFMVDSDMSWAADSFIRILCLCTKMEVVGATYPAKMDPLTYMIKADDVSHMVANSYGCLDVHGMGLGFTCVQRGVMVQLAERAPKRRFYGSPDIVPHIFRQDCLGDDFRGEDMAFFSDIRELGYKVWMDPSVKLGHIGSKMYCGSASEALLRENHE